MARRQIRAFIGFKGAGKDYCCDKLVEEQGFLKLSFAKELRLATYDILGLPYKSDEDYNKTKDNLLFNNSTLRDFIRRVAQACKKEDKDIWTKKLIKAVKSSVKNVCISDLRYAREYEYLEKYAADNNIDFKVYFTDYHSERYTGDSTVLTEKLADYIKKAGYKDMQQVHGYDIVTYGKLVESKAPDWE